MCHVCIELYLDFQPIYAIFNLSMKTSPIALPHRYNNDIPAVSEMNKQ